MSKLLDFDTWLYDRISDATTGVSIYNTIAPEQAVYPCVIFAPYGDPVDLTETGPQRVQTTFDFTIWVIGEGSTSRGFSLLPLQEVYDDIDAALYDVQPTTEGDTVIASITRINPIKRVEVDKNTVYTYLGGRYRAIIHTA